MRKPLLGLLAGALAAALALPLWGLGWLDRWENATWAWRAAAMAGPGKATPGICLVYLDQASLDWAKRESDLSWPWPRSIYSEALAFCRRAGAASVAFDILFLEPSFYGVDDDAALAAALGEGPGVVLGVPVAGSLGTQAAWPASDRRAGLRIEGLPAWLAAGQGEAVKARAASFPVPELAAAAAWLGGVHDDPDADAVFRRATLFKVFDGKAVPSLALASHLAALARQGKRPALSIAPGALRVGEREVPLDRAGRAILRFRGEQAAYRTFSMAAILQSELRIREGGKPVVDPAELKDAHVLFAFSAPGLLDLRPTPLRRVAPGAEVHATALDNLLSGDFIATVPAWLSALTVLASALAAGWLAAMGRGPWQMGAVAATFLLLPFAGAFWTYRLGFWWPVIPHAVAGGAAAFGGITAGFLVERRARRFIRQAFEFYLSKDVIERIMKDPAGLKLGGERRELTIFFSDLQGFTSISERLSPEALIELLNDCLGDLTDIVLEENGTFDKYVGDAIVAFWNAPLSQPDHAERACRAAIRCQRRLAERRAELARRTGVELRVRIGLNTGEAVVGNMGSRKKFNFTVLGDAANLASRLEGANKAFGTGILVSETVWSATGGRFVGREVGLIRVVGRKEPVRVFELAGLPGEERPGLFAGYAAALALLRAGRPGEACRAFEQAGTDPLSRAYATRLRELERGGVPWDGVWNLHEK